MRSSIPLTVCFPLGASSGARARLSFANATEPDAQILNYQHPEANSTLLNQKHRAPVQHQASNAGLNGSSPGRGPFKRFRAGTGPKGLSFPPAQGSATETI